MFKNLHKKEVNTAEPQTIIFFIKGDHPNLNESEKTKSEARNLLVNPVRVLNPDRVNFAHIFAKYVKYFL